MTTTTDDLVAFVTARLDEDEAIAGLSRDWQVEGVTGCDIVGDDLHIYDEGGHDERDAAHIARHDPARVLREVEAKRKILAEHASYQCLYPEGLRCFRCASDSVYRSGAAIHEAWPCPTMRAIAAVWSDHPDYREWV